LPFAPMKARRRILRGPEGTAARRISGFSQAVTSHFMHAERASPGRRSRASSILEARARGEAPVTVCAVQGLLLRPLPPGTLERAALTVRVGESCPPETVEAVLLRCGYERTELVEGPGQFSRRGGILDIFSPSGTQPIRMEFWGDTIDSMGTWMWNASVARNTRNCASCRQANACPPGGGGEAGLARPFASPDEAG
jgi:transcription-repair coupling factor (superfamily II helicase)